LKCRSGEYYEQKQLLNQASYRRIMQRIPIKGDAELPQL
jgi:hypothetical protein